MMNLSKQLRVTAMLPVSFAMLTGATLAQQTTGMSADTGIPAATDGSGWIGILILWLIPAAGIGAAVAFSILDKKLRASGYDVRGKPTIRTEK